MERKQKSIAFVVTVMAIIMILLIGPMDIFHHGYYCNVIDWNKIEDSDRLEKIDLQDEEFEMEFKPVKKHFAGFGIHLSNQPDNNFGTLRMTVHKKNGKIIDSVDIDLENVKENSWYWVYFNKTLKKDRTYILHISAYDCETVPCLQRISPDYLTDENISDNVLIGYAYAESTFSFQNKILIILFIVSLWGFICSAMVNTDKHKILKLSKMISIFVFLTTVLAWNYFYNSMDTSNGNFYRFQADSESLVSAIIKAEHDNVKINMEELKYGLAFYENVEGNSYYLTQLITDGNWTKGYSNSAPSVVVNSNDHTRKIAIVGNYIKFKNGDLFQITNIVDDGANIVIELNSDKILSEVKYGSLLEASFYDSNMNEFSKGELTAYESQYGLQGRVFKHLARHMKYENAVANLNLLCCLAAGAVFTLISFLVAVKYNRVFAGIFFVTFWLSPWIVSFARNLYWVEFTWFLSTAIGLFCAWKIHDSRCRILSYILAIITIAMKCLCGYEYITSIMMSLIAFLLADFIVSCAKRNREKQKLIFRTTFFIGISALIGFMVAICIHAPLKGDGDILEGIKNIFEQDVLRRTVGANLNDFSEEYWASFRASIWEVFCSYFKFPTQIITGIDGNVFTILCIIPLFIFAMQYHKNKLNIELLALYIITFFTSISWFCLAKSHSYIHRHMNYVLWYTGFVQTCFYCVTDWICRMKSNKVITGG